MPSHKPTIAALVFVCLTGMSLIAEDADDEVKKLTNNSNSVINGFRSKLKFSCSSAWGSWVVDRLFDGKPQTSWFSGTGDSAALGKKPWIAVEFPMAATVTRVTLLSNREPSYPAGYTILAGRLELLDHKGKVIYSQDDQLSPKRPDMEFRPRMPIRGVYKIRFTSLKDEGNKNGSTDVALGEVLVE